MSREKELSREKAKPTADGTQAAVRGARAAPPVLCMDIDSTECKYLLVGGADARIGLFDLDSGEGDSKQQARTVEPLLTSRRVAAAEHSTSGDILGGHLYSVTALEWYKIDNGMFISASFDKTVKVWDTNAFRPACEFRLKERVFSATTSAVAVCHQLIAVGMDSPTVHLCDMASGASTHQLEGHNGPIWTTAWSPTHEFVLATGSCDQSIRLWDIRRSGSTACLLALDLNSATGGQRRQRFIDHVGEGGIMEADAEHAQQTKEEREKKDKKKDKKDKKDKKKGKKEKREEKEKKRKRAGGSSSDAGVLDSLDVSAWFTSSASSASLGGAESSSSSSSSSAVPLAGPYSQLQNSRFVEACSHHGVVCGLRFSPDGQQVMV
jgi:WD40 repeat protein